jgi:hypothetical protein
MLLAITIAVVLLAVVAWVAKTPGRPRAPYTEHRVRRRVRDEWS